MTSRFHQLHCLNLIRQYTWRDYYDQHPNLVQKPTDMTRADEKGQRFHVDHCIETLRLSLMCHGDITPYLHVKHSNEDKLGTADFNAKHKCRNFDRIVDDFEKKVVRTRWPNFPSKQYESIPGLQS
jgi:Mycotoxin biosynthesis protein UstYa